VYLLGALGPMEMAGWYVERKLMSIQIWRAARALV